MKCPTIVAKVTKFMKTVKFMRIRQSLHKIYEIYSKCYLKVPNFAKSMKIYENSKAHPQNLKFFQRVARKAHLNLGINYEFYKIYKNCEIFDNLPAPLGSRIDEERSQLR